MSSEGLSETAEEAHPDNIAQRPASNLLLAGTGLSLALAVSAVVGLSNNDTTVPAPVAASESPADRPVVSLAAPGSNPAAESPSGPQSMTPSAMTPSAMAALPMAPIDMAPLPMDRISVGQLTVDQMPAASPLSSNSRPRQQPEPRHSAASEGFARLGKFEEPDRPRPLDQPQLRRSPGKYR